MATDGATPGTDDGWPEFTYQYVQHYFWEPQHLLLETKRLPVDAGESRKEVVDAKMRRQEVPLNYLLNVMLRVAPMSLRLAALRPFGLGEGDPGLRTLTLRMPPIRHWIQPDVYLESESSRVMIELKVKAALGLEQLRKYIRLHNDLNDDGPVRTSYLLLLVNHDPLKIEDYPQAVPLDSIPAALPAAVGIEARGITFGATTWQRYGQNLQRELVRGHPDQTAAEMLESLVGDFLADLEARDLYKADG